MTVITGPSGEGLDLGFQIAAWVLSGLLTLFCVVSILASVKKEREGIISSRDCSVVFERMMFFVFIGSCVSNVLLVFGGSFNVYFWVNIGVIVDIFWNFQILLFFPVEHPILLKAIFFVMFIITKIILIGCIITNIVFFGIVGYITWGHILFLCAIPFRILFIISETMVLNECMGREYPVCYSFLRSTGNFNIAGLYNENPPAFQEISFDPIHQQKTMSPHPSTWDNQDIYEWLTFLGMEYYAPLFEKHQISGTLLLKLSMDEISRIGVNNLVHRRSIVAGIEALNFYSEKYKSAPAPCGASVQQVCEWLTQTLNCPEKYVKNFRKYCIHGTMLLRITDIFLDRVIGIREESLRKSITLFVNHISKSKTNLLNIASVSTNPFDFPVSYWPVEATALFFAENGELMQYQQAINSNFVSGVVLLDCYENNTLGTILNITDSVEVKRVETVLDAICNSESLSPNGEQDIHHTLTRLFHKQGVIRSFRKPEATLGTVGVGIEENHEVKIEKEMCEICCERERKIAFKPCSHFRMCETCAKKVSTCPWCKQHIVEKIKIFE